jgi:choice-of-anchor C domain-containing protein
MEGCIAGVAVRRRPSEETGMDCAKWLGAVVILSAGVLVTSGLAQGFLANRSFENGADPGEAMVLTPGSKAIEGWSVVGGNISYVGGKWQASQGLRSIALPCGGGISQTFKTEKDEKYEVRFSMAGDPSASPAVKSVTVTFGTTNRPFTFDTTGRSAAAMGWDSRAWIFKATGETTTIAFHSLKAKCSTPAVDNVRVVPGDSDVQAHPLDAPARREASLSGDFRSLMWKRPVDERRLSSGQ